MPRRDDPIDLDGLDVAFDDDGPGDELDAHEPDADRPSRRSERGGDAHPEVAELLDDLELLVEDGQLDAAETVLAELEGHAAIVAEAFEVRLGDLFEMVAFEVLEREHDDERALRLQERAVAHGCVDQASAKTSLAWWLLDAGDRERGEDLFAELLDADPEGVPLRVDLGLARTTTDPDGALIALDEAVDLARRTGDREGLSFARVERQELRFVRGLPADADDRAAVALQREKRNQLALMLRDDAFARRGGSPGGIGHPERRAVGWFLGDELPLARQRWPRLSLATTDAPEAHRRAVEHALRQLATLSSGPFGVVGLTVDEVVAAGVDPTHPRGLDDLAEDRHAAGRSVTWPPGRNDPCWCGSDRKHKRCCGGF